MSLRLQYEAICGSCQKRMFPGTEASLVKHPDGHTVAFHVGDCPSDASAPVAPKKRSTNDNFLSLQCSNTPCSNAVGVGIRRGTPAPERCWLCGSRWAWTSDDGWLEDAA